MSAAFALLCGSVQASPVIERTAAGPRVVLMLRVEVSRSAELWRVIAYQGAMFDAAKALEFKQPVAVRGEIEIRLDESEGETKILRTIVARTIISLGPMPAFLAAAE